MPHTLLCVVLGPSASVIWYSNTPPVTSNRKKSTGLMSASSAPSTLPIEQGLTMSTVRPVHRVCDSRLLRTTRHSPHRSSAEPSTRPPRCSCGDQALSLSGHPRLYTVSEPYAHALSLHYLGGSNTFATRPAHMHTTHAKHPFSQASPAHECIRQPCPAQGLTGT